jgi:hypothetical protein
MFSADSAAKQFCIKVKGGGTFVFQGTPKENIQNNRENAFAGVYLFDLTLEKNEHKDKILVQFKGDRDESLNSKLDTYSPSNVLYLWPYFK